jgi:hypothetical protein
LKSIDWQFIPFWQTPRLLDETTDDLPNHIPIVHEQILERLSELDASHRQVTKRLHKNIQPHVHLLEQANLKVFEMYKNLSLAQMYVHRSQTSVLKAKGTEAGEGVVGAVSLLKAWEQKEEYTQLNVILAQVEKVLESEGSLEERIQNFDARRPDALKECHDIIQLADELAAHVQDDTLSRLDCLNELRKRTHTVRTTFSNRLHILLESITVRSCNGHYFSSEEYSLLVQSIRHVVMMPQDPCASQLWSKTWSTSVQTALLFEADRALCLALLDPTDVIDSEYDKELMALNYQIDQDWGNQPHKLQTMTHNLVTIRFDFEQELNHLPAVYHRLCVLLTNVLYGQQCLLEWHQSAIREDWAKSNDMDDHKWLQLVLEEMSSRRLAVWNHCLGVFQKCIDEYLPFAGKKTLFDWKDGVHDDSEWWDDLEGLQDIFRLTEQFLSMRQEFLEPCADTSSKAAEYDDDHAGESLLEKLSTLMKKHLRAVHVETMNSMGMMLSQEDWDLVRFKRSETHHAEGENPDTIILEVRTDWLTVGCNYRALSPPFSLLSLFHHRFVASPRWLDRVQHQVSTSVRSKLEQPILQGRKVKCIEALCQARQSFSRR